MEKEKTTRDPIRFWGGVLGAVALGFVILMAVVTQFRSSRPHTASTQTPAKTQAAVRTQAVVKTPAARPSAAVNPAAAVKPLTDAERKVSEALWVEQKKLDTDSARVVAVGTDSRHRVAETIGKQFSVPEKLVTDLRAQKLGYGEITATLALSQQLMKRTKVTQQKALDKVLALRKSGQGWGAIARSLDLKLGDVLSDVQKTDKQLAKLDTGKSAKATKS